MNAHDNEGNTPLHETFPSGMEEDLLMLGADLNARNNDCETPIFMTVDTFCGPMVRGLNEGTFTSRMLFIHVMEGPRHDRQRHRRIHSSKGF